MVSEHKDANDGTQSKERWVKKRNEKCSYCHMEGHLIDQCYKLKGYPEKKGIDRCSYCHMKGHLKEQCYKLNGYPEWFKGKKEIRGQKGTGTSINCVDTAPVSGSQNVTSGFVQELIKKELANLFKDQVTHSAGTCSSFHTCTDSGNFDEEWILDSGASNHICCNPKLLHNIKPLPTHKPILLPDHTIRFVTKTGSVTLFNNVVLENVLFLPSFKHNLISVSSLCQSSKLKCIFSSNECIIQDQSSELMVAVGKIRRNLYILNKDSSHSLHSNNSVCFSSSVGKTNVESCKLWHNRLGHPSIAVLNHLDVFSKTSNSVLNDIECLVCPLAKQHRLLFPESNSDSSNCFDLIHVDVWGPFKEPSITNTPYFLTIVDDHSRATWTYLMTHKSQVLTHLKVFFIMIETQFQTKVKKIRSDNGTEFHNRDCHTLFTSLGIVHQHSCVYTPQQNGLVERKHQHLLQIARALMFQASMPTKFWPFSILSATYLINRIPSPILHWKTPFQILNKRAPSYDHLRTFGCLSYATNNTPHKGKFDKRAHRCVLIGYGSGQKGYKLYNLDDHTIFVNRDVRFFENLFPFDTHQNNTIPTSPLPSTLFQEMGTDINQTNSTSPTATENFTEENTPTPPSPISTPIPAQPCSPKDHDSHSPSSPSQQPSSEQPSSQSILPDLTPVPFHSQRIRTKPVWHKDFIMSASTNQSTAPPYPHETAYMTFAANVSKIQVPHFYFQAVQDDRWKKAMADELEALEANHTWNIVSLPKGRKAIGSKWIYKIKHNADGSVDKFKARLVAKGYHQKEGFDFHESFAPVAKPVTVRILLALAAAKNWFLHQLDINNAFLHGYIDEEIYMEPPDGYTRTAPGQVCQLKRSLYGLKQASREWNKEICKILLNYGFAQSSHDHCMFTKGSTDRFIALVIYVDDILITGTHLEDISAIKDRLHSVFTIKDLGEAKYFLGIEIYRNSKGIHLSQRKYIEDIVKDCGLLQSKPCSSPFPLNLKLSITGQSLSDPTSYRRLVGRLLYLSFTRPDVAYAVQQLSQFLHSPTSQHWSAALHVVRYLRGCSSSGLFFPAANSTDLKGFADADWATCPDSRRSLTGYCILLGDALVSWKTKKQVTVSRSSAEAEYRSLAATTCELQWIHYLLKDLLITVQLPIPLHCDSQAAIHISENPVFHERTKHLDIDCHIVRDKFKEGFLSLQHIRSRNQIADLFTKALDRRQFDFLLPKMNLFDSSQLHLEGGVLNSN